MFSSSESRDMTCTALTFGYMATLLIIFRGDPGSYLNSQYSARIKGKTLLGTLVVSFKTVAARGQEEVVGAGQSAAFLAPQHLPAAPRAQGVTRAPLRRRARRDRRRARGERPSAVRPNARPTRRRRDAKSPPPSVRDRSEVLAHHPSVSRCAPHPRAPPAALPAPASTGAHFNPL